MPLTGRYLLDTNILIALLAAEPRVVERVRSAEAVHVPVIALGELYYGVRHSARVAENVERVAKLAATAAVLPCDLPTAHTELSVDRSGEPSAAIRARVNRARAVQLARFADRDGLFANAHMAPEDLARYCRIGDAADALLKTAIHRLGLSARAYHRVLKIARTIADLAGAAQIATAHVSEAIQYRRFDRPTG